MAALRNIPRFGCRARVSISALLFLVFVMQNGLLVDRASGVALRPSQRRQDLYNHTNRSNTVHIDQERLLRKNTIGFPKSNRAKRNFSASQPQGRDLRVAKWRFKNHTSMRQIFSIEGEHDREARESVEYEEDVEGHRVADEDHEPEEEYEEEDEMDEDPADSHREDGELWGSDGHRGKRLALGETGEKTSETSQSHDGTSVSKSKGISSKEKSSHVEPDKDEAEEQTPKSGASKSGGGGDHFRGLQGGNVDGTNITQLSYMIFKIVKNYKIKSVVDMPCRNTLKWFPELLNRLDFEVIGFKYYCVDTEEPSQDDIRDLFTDAGSPEFLSIAPEQAHMLPKTDLVFSWDGPQQWGVARTWGFFTALRKIRPKYVIVTNNPGQANHGKDKHIVNLRKQPFHFDQAMRVISNIHTSDVPKQLLFYEVDGIRKGF